ncbi:helix-turn-helix transcriptional regulator [Zhihengliuella sp. ISTPL4]|uniref:helix-turn-helix transcriptional regulator n=1 Tax=Zhihengliuella sp. ISTPL4 TaxID=2058657 RepID=UPI00130514CA|nr:helix-turn-helix transcriptional regulator [Zhihengliuella sp. ISTPL4]
MVARLVAALPDDPEAVLALAARLGPEQRRGLRRLPDPLPLGADPSRLAGIPETDRRLLLAVALSLGDRLDPVLALDGRPVEGVLSSAAARYLTIHAGRVRLTDPRIGADVRLAATAGEVACAHERLAAAAAATGDRLAAAWHHARARPVADRASAVALHALAQAAAADGKAERALLLAAEAAAHAATGGLGEETRLFAGCAALACGFAADAESWLSALFPYAAEHRRVRALGPLLAARAFRHGTVPAIDPPRFAPISVADTTSWARSAGLAAILCAERGDHRGERRWLGALRDAAVGAESSGRLRDAAASLCRLLAGEGGTGEECAPGELLGGVPVALRAACEGDIDEGLRLLRTACIPRATDGDLLLPGFGGAPIVRSYQAVTEVLLLVWRGDIGSAREVLRQAAVDLPVAIPFAGLGVVLARRLDLAVLGALSPMARSLTAVVPPAMGCDVLVDRAVEAFLAGSFEAAARGMGLWRDRGAPQSSFAVPGLDGALLAARTEEAPPVHPPETEVVVALQRAIGGSSAGAWRTEHEAARDAARRLRSPFTRGRVETLLGVHAGLHGDAAAARDHLQQAERLFEAAGADAWGRAVRRRLDRLQASVDEADSGAERLRACRSAWAQQLTPRELEVAMLAVGGSGNRAIAEHLSVSVRTVEVHLGRVFAKLHVRTRVELTVLAHRTERYL